MQCVVIGAGVVGLTTAWTLQQDGHQVTVVDRADHVAAETSHANGGQLSYSYVAPMADPTVPPALPGYLLRTESPVRYRPSLRPAQWQWALEFFRACTKQQSAETTRHLLRLSFLSRSQFHEVLQQVPLSFSHRQNGKLVVYSSPEAFDKSCRQVTLQRDLGCEQQPLDRDACLAAEPALAALAPRLCGGVLTPSEEVGDCRAFCQALATQMQQGENPVTLLLGTDVHAFVPTAKGSRRLHSLETSRGTLTADAFVLAAGMGAAALARPLGLSLPIEAVKGYSLSVPITDARKAPSLSITDHARRVVYAPLGSVLRVAGMADVVGPNREISASRVALLRRQAGEAFPGAGAYDEAEAWAGLRPTTPKGPPILGESPIENLFLNVGHGSLGFTLSMGAARVVANAVAGKPAPISLEGFAFQA